ncbi:butyrophilin-like protein 9 isoform X2 [Mugil cephalus]|uniref:butyrophilin-like protein 9 isoform X2 n=1 Tax=Mugil cephalus TaxID=48193 RepID=UPI001FB71ED0|nr:butyrophilin-like protein 9 isoform X2 [Mugil cephalus]
MNTCLFLVVALLSFCAGNESVFPESKTIVAFAGDSVILPCQIPGSSSPPTVEWLKEGLTPDIVFLYRDGFETFEMKNPVFRYRTNLILDQLNNGNLSLWIFDLLPSDAGKYVCRTLSKKKPVVITKLELFVAAISEPKLSIVPSVGGGFALRCEAKCWLPKPEIMFLNDQGKDIGSENQTSVQEANGCFTVTKTVAVKTQTNSVTCRVRQPQINQIRSTDTSIPDECIKSCFLPTILVAVLASCLILGGILVCVEKFQPCSTSTRADNAANAKSPEKEEIHSPTKGLNSQQPVLHSKSSPDVSKRAVSPPPGFLHKNDPQPASSTSSPPKRENSKPPTENIHGNSSTLLATKGTTSSSSSSTSGEMVISRSKSLSEPRQSGARPQRRLTFSSNRFSVLEEDSKPLI